MKIGMRIKPTIGSLGVSFNCTLIVYSMQKRFLFRGLAAIFLDVGSRLIDRPIEYL
jgi:hypothetical protein